MMIDFVSTFLNLKASEAKLDTDKTNSMTLEQQAEFRNTIDVTVKSLSWEVLKDEFVVKLHTKHENELQYHIDKIEYLEKRLDSLKKYAKELK